MRHLGLWAALTLSAVVALSSGSARADEGDCADFRSKIAAADAAGDAFPGYYRVRGELGHLYAKFCPRDPPVRLTDEQYARVCGGPVPSDPDQRAEMLQLCAVQGAYPVDYSLSDIPIQEVTTPANNHPNGMPAASSARTGQIAQDPGYQRMCREAAANENVCRQRQANIRSCQADPSDPTKCSKGELGTAGQAGAFDDCATLYRGVVRMCRVVDERAKAPLAPPKPVQTAKVAPPPPPSKADPNAPQPSRPPPQQAAAPAMSDKCQKLVSDYVEASQANDGPKALAGYNALKQAGGCGVLAKVDRPMPAAAPSAEDPRFATRGSTALSDQVIGGCDASPDVCAARVQQLRAGVSPEAVAALWMNAISVGLELGSAMAQTGAAIGAQRIPTVSGGNTNMNSIGNRPVRNTYGQGSPSGVGQPQINNGCVECRTGTAR